MKLENVAARIPVPLRPDRLTRIHDDDLPLRDEAAGTPRRGGSSLPVDAAGRQRRDALVFGDLMASVRLDDGNEPSHHQNVLVPDSHRRLLRSLTRRRGPSER